MATQRMHVAKINYVAISEAVSVTRDVATEAVKQLLWCLLEAMSNRKDVIIDIGIGASLCPAPARSHALQRTAVARRKKCLAASAPAVSCARARVRAIHSVLVGTAQAT